MRYFRKSETEVYGYDDTQSDLVQLAIQSGWQEITGEWPPAPEPEPLKTQFTSLEFLDRFTEAEQILVVTATLSNAQVKLWYDKMLAASFVDLTDLRVDYGLSALVSAGLLASERKTEILTP